MVATTFAADTPIAVLGADATGTPVGSGPRSECDDTPPLCAGRPATIVGTDGADELTGTPGVDVIVGLDVLLQGRLQPRIGRAPDQQVVHAHRHEQRDHQQHHAGRQEAEAESAQQINRFFNEMLAAVDPIRLPLLRPSW